jgi:hypothetical protein
MLAAGDSDPPASSIRSKNLETCKTPDLPLPPLPTAKKVSAAVVLEEHRNGRFYQQLQIETNSATKRKRKRKKKKQHKTSSSSKHLLALLLYAILSRRRRRWIPGYKSASENSTKPEKNHIVDISRNRKTRRREGRRMHLTFP